MRLIVALLCFASVSITGSATEEQQIAAWYKRAVAGDREAVEKCLGFLEAAVKAHPENQLARVYLGSTYTLRSRDMGIGPAKLAALKQGLALMDSAVAAAPDNPRVRLVRALTTDSLPFFLGRKQSTRDDFDVLAKMAARSPQKFSEDDLAVIRHHAR
jgi:hypothetical protein